MISAVVAMSLLVTAGQAQAQGPPPPKIVMVNVEGCVSGLTLKAARPASIDEAELIVSPTYRMSGTKSVKAEIRKLNGSLVRVRAELKDVPGTPRPTARLGNTSVTIGTGDDPPTASRAPEPPGLDVQSVEALDGRCGGK